MKGAWRWDCSRDGCFSYAHRPRLELLAEALPGRVAFSDVDAVVELGGRFLFLEFKPWEQRPLPRGQELMLERLSCLPHSTVLAVFVDPSPGWSPHTVVGCTEGRWHQPEPCTLDGLRAYITRWCEAAL